jgi:redox-sensitive bicupin YhaK (pirin superfamily)
MHGFQLWANLPSSLKMTSPRYQDLQSKDIPQVVDDDGTSVRIVCGDFWGKSGPVDGVAAEPQYLDVFVPPGRSLPVETTRRSFAYVFEGSGTFGNASEPRAVATDTLGHADPKDGARAGNRSLIVFDRGDEVVVQAGPAGIRFLLVSGKPIEEPIAWYGPIVMNTREEIQQAFSEFKAGTFLKHKK